MDLLDSEMKPGSEARRSRTHERSSDGDANDRRGQAHTPMNSYWDIRQLSVYLHVKPSTLYSWAEQGRIPCLKIHGLVRFRRDDIEHWVESFRVQDKGIPCKPAPRSPRAALNDLVARAMAQAYNSGPRGNQTRSSPIGKEETDGAI